MENKDIVPSESPKVNETSPLVLEEKEVAEASREGILTKLAAGLPGPSVETGDKPTSSTTPVNAAVTDSRDTAIQVASSSEGEDQSGTSSDVQTVIAAERSEPLTEEPVTSVTTTGSPSNSGSELEIRREDERLFNKTMWMLIWQVLWLGIPISEVSFAIKFVRSCSDGEMLPLLLVVVGLVTFLALFARIARNVTRKLRLYNEQNVLAWLTILVLDVLCIILYTTEIAYFYTIDKEKCNHEFYAYAFYLNNAALGVMPIMIFLNRRTYLCCINALRG